MVSAMDPSTSISGLQDRVIVGLWPGSLCSVPGQFFALTVPLSTQMYECELVNLML